MGEWNLASPSLPADESRKFHSAFYKPLKGANPKKDGFDICFISADGQYISPLNP
jgi:hypothetical protein